MRALRLAMWSGPRNISTAMMRSWSSRADTFVTDEPLYAHYLATTGIDHPGREEVVAAYDGDWRRVVEWLTGPVPEGKAVWFQKHMTLHLTPEVGREWLGELQNAFLIRHPAEVIPSYARVRARPTVGDLGYPQQTALFEEVAAATGRTPPVVDSRDVLEDPRATLTALCAAVGVAFDEAMLSWPAGRHPQDGVWAPHWYQAVERSTGFAPYRPKQEPVPTALAGVYQQCLAHYQRMHAVRLAPPEPS
ncbi:MAG TPA: HAD family hydrolase [Thermoanaerobaculia bacterium]|nr:HAD family hydrolase [Thermoanaerobaculia bacterium]